MDIMDILNVKDFSLEKEGLTKSSEWIKKTKKENKVFFEKKVKEEIILLLEEINNCSMRFLLFSLYSKRNIYISHILLKKLLIELKKENKISMEKIGNVFVIKKL